MAASIKINCASVSADDFFLLRESIIDREACLRRRRRPATTDAKPGHNHAAPELKLEHFDFFFLLVFPPLFFNSDLRRQARVLNKVEKSIL